MVPGSGGQHRKETRCQLRGTQYHLVTRHAGLRAQHIYRLRAWATRQALQWKRNRLPRGKCLRAPDPCPAPAHADHRRVRFTAKQCVGRGRLHAQHHLGLRHGAGAGRLRTGLQVRGIVHAAGPAGPGSIHTAAPGAASFLTVSGVAATRRASGPFFQHQHLHSHALLRSCAQSRRCQAERGAAASGTGRRPRSARVPIVYAPRQRQLRVGPLSAPCCCSATDPGDRSRPASRCRKRRR